MKPKVGVFSFTGCEGCQLQILECENELLDILNLVEIVTFREAMDKISDDYQIAFIDGAITRQEEIERLKEIRERASILVALGSCAAFGGINCLKNRFPMDEVLRYVYGDKAHYFDTLPARGADAYVKVDYYVYGCPATKSELLHVLKSLVLGIKPRIPNYPVCVECKLKENVCLFDKGEVCLGPVTRAGCGALCPSYGHRCEGCRGFVDDPNINAHKETLQKAGLTVEELMQEFTMFCSCPLEKLEQTKSEA
ncbi:NADH:ubiquinone oxidoreductase [Candidatus Poribacteria bacterium]|nr:MAG: NADH:ubiquinone oxidoreductase [Candidatus Poribacteria bacterium]